MAKTTDQNKTEVGLGIGTIGEVKAEVDMEKDHGERVEKGKVKKARGKERLMEESWLHHVGNSRTPELAGTARIVDSPTISPQWRFKPIGVTIPATSLRMVMGCKVNLNNNISHHP